MGIEMVDSGFVVKNRSNWNSRPLHDEIMWSLELCSLSRWILQISVQQESSYIELVGVFKVVTNPINPVGVGRLFQEKRTRLSF